MIIIIILKYDILMTDMEMMILQWYSIVIEILYLLFVF